MFIHFGAYSRLEGEWRRPDGTLCQDAEWIQRQCAVPKAEYEKLIEDFDPAKFDAKEIVSLAKAAGQRYIVITSKHHDGYAMWPTKVNKWNLRDHSSFDRNRDILAELKHEADRQGIKLGLYYSIWDWHDPDAANPATFSAYRERMRAQLTELVENYDPAVLWFDGDWATTNPVNPWKREYGAELESYLRELSPRMMINNRIGFRPEGVKHRRVVDGDFGTPEQSIPTAQVDAQLWESCMTIAAKWGFARWDTKWKDAGVLTRNLIDIAARGGNYLLNVGPDRNGAVPREAADRLRAMGSWLGTVGQNRAVHGAEAAGLVADPEWGSVSRNGNRLYASVYSWPGAGNRLHLKANDDFTVLGARVLGSGQRMRVERAGDGYDLIPSGDATNGVATVIELTILPELGAPWSFGRGLKAEYFPNPTLSGEPALRRTDANLNFSWRYTGSPADGFSARWTGFVQPRYSDTYTFATVSDDVAKVWIDGKLVIDASEPHEVQIDKATVELQAGKRYPIKVEYAEHTGEAFLKLLWSSPNQRQEIVPRDRLHPAG